MIFRVTVYFLVFVCVTISVFSSNVWADSETTEHSQLIYQLSCSNKDAQAIVAVLADTSSQRSPRTWLEWTVLFGEEESRFKIALNTSPEAIHKKFLLPNLSLKSQLPDGQIANITLVHLGRFDAFTVDILLPDVELSGLYCQRSW
jgi:hypothetical protein